MPSLLLGLGMYLLWGPSCAGVAVVKHLVASCQTYFQCVMSARRNHPDATEADITVGVQRERTCQTVKPWHQTKGKIQGQGRGGELDCLKKLWKRKTSYLLPVFEIKTMSTVFSRLPDHPFAAKLLLVLQHLIEAFPSGSCELCKARAKACEVWLAEILADRKHGRVSLMQEGIPWKSNDHMVEGFWKQVPKTGEDWVLPCSSLETIGP